MEGPLKIVMTADTVGGVWTYAIDLCKALASYDTEIHLMTMGALLSREQNQQVEQLHNVRLYESNYKLEWMQDCHEDVAMAKKWVESVYHKVQPHILHFNNYGQTASEWNCPVITVYHSCVRTWWRAVKGEDTPADWQWYDETLKKAIASSDVVVAPSQGVLDQAQEVHGHILHSKVIYNGRELHFGNINHKEHYILSAGRIWDEAKNISLLSQVAKDLKWPVYIAGNNVDPDTGQAPQPENVHFVGQLSQDDMQQCMERASVFVMPAKYEPFGLAVLEAASAGCALALADIATLREIWGDASVYFDPLNEEEATRVINNIIEDEDLRRSMAAKASIRAKDFSVKNMAEGYMNLYQKLLEEYKVELNQ